MHYYPRKRPQQIADDAKWKAEQEKQRREQAIANTTGIRILVAIVAAVPVRLMKRDLLFVVEQPSTLLDESRLAVVARQHGIKKAKDTQRARYLAPGMVLWAIVLVVLYHGGKRRDSKKLHVSPLVFPGQMNADACQMGLHGRFD